ncbi:hypothetical protein EUGRSUZ_F01863 [Eucalyptus grandis]|uniref:Uncharacterized protein n=2 Tax=Eucalyptus grandis TaxID=71139 RepID=A0ACC3KGU8_EUCGR|nr:hypothetical protein EUGRSUZ_F01863 [Eucalyptus grandis]
MLPTVKLTSMEIWHKNGQNRSLYCRNQTITSHVPLPILMALMVTAFKMLFLSSIYQTPWSAQSPTKQSLPAYRLKDIDCTETY